MRFADLSSSRPLFLPCALVAIMTLAACSSINDMFSPPASKPPAASPSSPSSEAKGGAAAGGNTAKSAAAAAPASPEIKPVSPAAQRAFDTARQQMAAGRVAEAEQGFVALTKSNPELAGPYANLGLIHRQAGKTAEAKAALEKAVQLSPRSADLYNQLGITYRMTGDFTKAKASYEQAITLDAGYAPAVLNLGILYDLYLWDGARALELYDRYLQLTPGGDEQVQRWVSDLRNRSPRKDAPQRKEQG